MGRPMGGSVRTQKTSSPTIGPLDGRGLRQSVDEWNARNEEIVASLGRLVQQHAVWERGRGLDVGCQAGALADALAEITGVPWAGVDPGIEAARRSPGGQELLHGWGHDLPLETGAFDCALFANVYEHVQPEQRMATWREIRRVLRPGGIVVGQIPNPHFPIESHSRLPFLGWFPVETQRRLWRFAPVPWEHDFFVVRLTELVRDAEREGFTVVAAESFNYSPAVIPRQVRWAARALQAPMKHFPWAWQFVLRTPSR
jgi:SAM-dependent methyltransferase